MVDVGHGELREIEKRQAIYAASLLRGCCILDYVAAERQLRVPCSAPLPELHARAACLASGNLPQVSDGFLVFEELPPNAASVLFVLLGGWCRTKHWGDEDATMGPVGQADALSPSKPGISDHRRFWAPSAATVASTRPCQAGSGPPGSVFASDAKGG